MVSEATNSMGAPEKEVWNGMFNKCPIHIGSKVAEFMECG